MKHTHLTQEEHTELGNILKPLCDDFVDLHCKVANRNGKTSRPAVILGKITKLMSELKSELEKAYCTDCIDAELPISKEERRLRYDECTHVYYGNRIPTDRFKFVKDQFEIDRLTIAGKKLDVVVNEFEALIKADVRKGYETRENQEARIWSKHEKLLDQFIKFNIRL